MQNSTFVVLVCPLKYSPVELVESARIIFFLYHLSMTFRDIGDLIFYFFLQLDRTLGSFLKTLMTNFHMQGFM